MLLTIDTCKAIADVIQEKESHRKKIKRNQALNIIAKDFGFKAWASLKSAIEDTSPENLLELQVFEQGKMGIDFSPRGTDIDKYTCLYNPDAGRMFTIEYRGVNKVVLREFICYGQTVGCFHTNTERHFTNSEAVKGLMAEVKIGEKIRAAFQKEKPNNYLDMITKIKGVIFQSGGEDGDLLQFKTYGESDYIYLDENVKGEVIYYDSILSSIKEIEKHIQANEWYSWTLLPNDIKMSDIIRKRSFSSEYESRCPEARDSILKLVESKRNTEPSSEKTKELIELKHRRSTLVSKKGDSSFFFTSTPDSKSGRLPVNQKVLILDYIRKGYNGVGVESRLWSQIEKIYIRDSLTIGDAFALTNKSISNQDICRDVLQKTSLGAMPVGDELLFIMNNCRELEKELIDLEL